MSERRRTGGTDAVGPKDSVMRSSRRKGRSPVALYAGGLVAGLALVLAVVGLPMLRGCSGQGAATLPPATKAASVTTAVPAPSKTATASTEPTEGHKPPTSAEPSSSAVKAAAVRYPNPPQVKAERISSAKPTRKLVAITLDDGIPFDTRILDLLESRNVRCTTFILGQAVKAHPDLVKRLNAGGFEIANHTWDHKSLTKLSDSEIRSELERCQDQISDITGNQAPYMRPPGGATSKRVERVAASMGFRTVLWNRSFADTSKAATVDKIYHNVMDGLKPGDIILCHWGGKHNYEALKLILPEMERRGFTPVTMSELLAAEGTSGQ